jgi:integrase
MDGNMQNLMKRGLSYVVVATDPHSKTPSGKPKRVWKDIGPVADWKVLGKAALIRKVHSTVEAIRTGKNLDGPQNFAHTFEEFMIRYVEEKKLRTAGAIRRSITNHVLPVWGSRDFASIQRTDVTKLLDKIQDKSGKVMADKVLTIVSKMCTWHQARHHDYVSPIVKGMRRSDPNARARTRILNDDEIRIIWKAAEANGAFGAFVRMALLTGQRASKLLGMKWNQLEGDVWHIPSEAREKGNGGDLVLPAQAMAVLNSDSVRKFESCQSVFTLTGRGAIDDSSAKAAFAAKLDIPHWTIHDLRRTARSLMARADVRPDVAERVVGHAIKGVEGIYNRHDYREEKADALRKLAGLIQSILVAG